MSDGARICLGQIGAAHGVSGEVRLRSFTSDLDAIADYGPLETEDGRVFAIESLRPAKDYFVARLAGIHDRDAARALANTRLYVSRDRLPRLERPDEFYHADLIGLAVVDTAGKNLGTVIGIHNFGAGDLIEVRPGDRAGTEMIAFNEINVPVVDIRAGRIVIARSPAAAKGDGAKPGPVTGSADNSRAARPLTRTTRARRRSTLSHNRKAR